MFIRTLKYDFLFSKAAFLAMAGVIVALSLILRVTGLVDVGATGEITGIAGLIFVVAVLVVGLAAVLQIFQFYYKNFFDDTGYLMLTLPVKRLTLLVSKLVVSVVWFNFMLLSSVAVALILTYTPIPELGWDVRSLLNAINLANFIAVVEINIMALFLVVTLFFAVTLAFSVIGHWNVHGIVSVVAGLLYAGLFFWMHATLGQRHREWTTVEREWITSIFNEYGEKIGEQVTHGSSTFQTSIIGTNIGRIPIGDAGAYLDIYRLGGSLVMCVLAFFATYYLLNRRASLR